jgi:hypothetical protein
MLLPFTEPSHFSESARYRTEIVPHAHDEPNVLQSGRVRNHLARLSPLTSSLGAHYVAPRPSHLLVEAPVAHHKEPSDASQWIRLPSRVRRAADRVEVHFEVG